MAAIEYRGANAVTNFDISIYADKLKKVQDQMQHVINTESSSEAQVLYNNQQENLVDQQEEKQVLNLNNQDTFPSSEHVESHSQLQLQPIIVMDPAEEHEHPWNLCLDTGFSSLPVSEIPFDEKPAELPDLFADSGFEDNIDFIFDAQFLESECNQDDALSGSTIYGVEVVDSMASMEQKEQEAMFTSPFASVSVTSNI